MRPDYRIGNVKTLVDGAGSWVVSYRNQKKYRRDYIHFESACRNNFSAQNLQLISTEQIRR